MRRTSAAGKARQLRAFSLWPVQASLAVTQKQNSQEPVQRRSGASRVRSGARSALPDNPDARCGAIAGRPWHAALTAPVNPSICVQACASQSIDPPFGHGTDMATPASKLPPEKPRVHWCQYLVVMLKLSLSRKTARWPSSHGWR